MWNLYAQPLLLWPLTTNMFVWVCCGASLKHSFCLQEYSFQVYLLGVCGCTLAYTADAIIYSYIHLIICTYVRGLTNMDGSYAGLVFFHIFWSIINFTYWWIKSIFSAAAAAILLYVQVYIHIWEMSLNGNRRGCVRFG